MIIMKPYLIYQYWVLLNVKIVNTCNNYRKMCFKQQQRLIKQNKFEENENHFDRLRVTMGATNLCFCSNTKLNAVNNFSSH